jgi:hypothetical protein
VKNEITLKEFGFQEKKFRWEKSIEFERVELENFSKSSWAKH